MRLNRISAAGLAFIAFFVVVQLFSCKLTGTDSPNSVLNIQIDKDNDSLMSFDTLIIKVYREDSTFVQEVFHGKLIDPKQVLGIHLDPRVGGQFKINYIGYKKGKIGLNRVVTIIGQTQTESKDMLVQVGSNIRDSIKADSASPEIILPADTSVSEGDSLHFRVIVNKPNGGLTSLTLKEALQGMLFDNSGLGSALGYFSWNPTYEQGRSEAYGLTFVYAYGAKKIEKVIYIKVLNVNRPPKFSVVADQKVKENETLAFRVYAADPDLDSLLLTADSLPPGAQFSGGFFSWKPLSGQRENYAIKLKVTDGKAFDLMALLVMVGNVDVPPPLTVQRIAPERDTSVNISPLLATYKINGALIQKKFNLIEGRNKLYMDTTVAGRTVIDTFIVTFDTVPPGRPAVQGPTPINFSVPNWTWTGGTGGNGIYRYRLDGLDLSNAKETKDTSFTPATELSGAFHTLYVQTRDLAGNWSSTGSWVIHIDTLRPDPPLLTINVATTTNNAQPTWSWIAVGEDASGRFRFKLDDPGLANSARYTKETSYTPSKAEILSEGLHTFYLQQQDSAGNWSAIISQRIWIDLTPPSMPKVYSVSFHTTNTRPSWHWSSGGSGGSGSYRLMLDDSTLHSGLGDVTDTSFTSQVDFGVGSKHTLYVKERDSAGNWSTSGSFRIQVHGQTGFAVANLGGLITTANNGATWDTVASGTGYDLNSIFFTSPNFGYAVGAKGTVLKTSNGGAAWNAINIGTIQNLNSIYFSDTKIGVIVGENGYLLRASNENATWDSIASHTRQYLTTTYFLDSKIGYAVGAFAFGKQSVVLRTKDGGASWDSLAGTIHGLLSVYFTDLNTGYAVGAAGSIIKTSDAGRNWIDMASGTTNFLRSVFFISADVGYIAGQAGTLLKTQDAGAHWNGLNIGTSEDIVSVYFTDIKTGFAAGSNATIFETMDGGNNWTHTAKILPSIFTSCGTG